MTIESRVSDLGRWCDEHAPLLICFSGGADSLFLLYTAVARLGPESITAFIADSPIRARKSIQRAKALAERFLVPLVTQPTEELLTPDFIMNDRYRCYYCKRELFASARRVAGERGIAVVADGTNVTDDVTERPGTKAAIEYGVRSPLREVGLDNDAIRSLLPLLVPGAPTASTTCLATRLPIGRTITPQSLAQIEAAELRLSSAGLRDLRVRHHGEFLRVEVHPDDRSAAMHHLSMVRGELPLPAYVDFDGYRPSGIQKDVV